MPATDVALSIGGTLHRGWTEVSIQRGMEQLAGAFSLKLTERWPGSERRPIRVGDPCAVTVDGEPVITGYVDDAEPFFDSGDRSITVRGRDRAGDLVDCSALEQSSGALTTGAAQFKGRTLLQVAKALCGPFGVSVTAATGAGGPFATLAVQQGETVMEFLDRASRHRGVLFMSDGLGGLVITRAGAERAATALVEGHNILAGKGAYTGRERFSLYTVKQAVWGGTLEATATDPAVPRRRPLVLVADGDVDLAAMQTRADWEARVRAGRSARAEVTVLGWCHATGLWRPNTLVRVESRTLDIQGERLIADVTLVRDGRGTRATLGLVPKEAFSTLTLPEAAGGSGMAP